MSGAENGVASATPDLAELIERAKAATGPDKDLSRDILTTFGGWAYEKRYRDAKPWMYGPQGYRKDPPGVGVFGAPHVTASIDAALALVERVLPGHQMNLHAYGMIAEASIGAHTTAQKVEAPTPPLAITLALLTALQSQGAS